MSTIARDAVFKIPELLEAILLEVDAVDLLVNVQRVCRTWRATAESFPTIQQALFLKPRWRKGDSFISGDVQVNPILLQAFRGFFSNHRDGVVENSYFGHYGPSFEGIPWLSNADSEAKFLSKSATWRRMLITQPPTTSIRVRDGTHGMRGNTRREAMLKFDDGLRMGTLYDLIQQNLGVVEMEWPILQCVNYESDTPTEKRDKSRRSDRKYLSRVTNRNAGVVVDYGEDPPRRVKKMTLDEKARIHVEFRVTNQCSGHPSGRGTRLPECEGAEKMNVPYGPVYFLAHASADWALWG